MGGVTGSAYDPTDELSKAPGTSVDAGVRIFRNVFNFADAGVGGTQNPLILARLPSGVVYDEARAASDQNISGTNVTIGVVGAAAKYAAAQAGGAANVTVRFNVPVAAQDDDPLTVPTEIIMTPSANWPASGILVTKVFVSKR
jgi:hypothetical protein